MFSYIHYNFYLLICCGVAVDSAISLLHSCMGHAGTKSLRLSLSQSDIVLQRCQDKINFEIKGSSIILKFLLNLL